MALPSSSPLHKALFGHAAGQSKYLIYTFLHGEFKPKNFQKLKEKWMGGIHRVYTRYKMVFTIVDVWTCIKKSVKMEYLSNKKILYFK